MVPRFAGLEFDAKSGAEVLFNRLSRFLAMNEVIQFVTQHGYSLVFLFVLADQIGAPVPASPMLLAAGTLAGEGWIHFLPACLLGIAAALTGNIFWYWIGRSRGSSVLSLLCRISLNPDSCVRNTASLFSRYGARSLLVAKFIPGLNTIAPPLAGIVRMPLAPFLIYDGLGAAIWVGIMIGLGYAFSQQIEALAESAARMGFILVLVLIGGLAAFIAWKCAQRYHFLRQMIMARISPSDLKEKIDRGEELAIFDVRHALEFKADPQMIPGAVYFSPANWKEEDYSLLRRKEVIVYCN
jgi:membrane protein DedA with SNARE-associated domain